jgi:hypothetical protein
MQVSSYIYLVSSRRRFDSKRSTSAVQPANQETDGKHSIHFHFHSFLSLLLALLQLCCIHLYADVGSEIDAGHKHMLTCGNSRGHMHDRPLAVNTSRRMVRKT